MPAVEAKCLLLHLVEQQPQLNAQETCSSEEWRQRAPAIAACSGTAAADTDSRPPKSF